MLQTCYSASACWADQGEDARNAEAKIMGSRITEGGDFNSRHMATKNSTQSNAINFVQHKNTDITCYLTLLDILDILNILFGFNGCRTSGTTF